MIFNRDLYFNSPENGWYLLILVPILLSYFFYHHYRNEKIKQFASQSLLDKLVVQNQKWASSAKIGLISTSWVLLCLALMDPRGNIRYEGDTNQKKNNQFKIVHNVSLLIDVSGSMGVHDSIDGETRLERAKEISESLIAQLKGVSFSAYAMTSQLTPLVPITFDSLFLRLVIKNLGLNAGEVGGTLFSPILKQFIHQDEFVTPEIYNTLVIFSDGGDNEIEKASERDKTTLARKIVAEIPEEILPRLKIYTIGLGAASPKAVPEVQVNGRAIMSKLEPALLEALANRGRGHYFNGNNNTPWMIASTLSKNISQDIENESVITSLSSQYVPKAALQLKSDHYFQIPLGMALLLFPFILILSSRYWTRNLSILGLLFFNAAFSNDEAIQNGFLAISLAQGHSYEQADALFQDLANQSLPDWQHAIVLYDWATLKLHQHLWKEALNYFGEIDMTKVTSPFLVRNILLNKAIALQSLANETMMDQDPASLIRKQSFLEQSSDLLKRWMEVDCRIQKIENQSKDIPCVITSIISNLEKELKLKINALIEKQKQEDQQKNKNKFTGTPAENILEESIIQLKNSAQQTRLVLEKGDATDNEAIFQPYQQAAKIGSEFYAAVLEEQKKQFLDSTLLNRCQKQPWDQVVPTYEKGRLIAETIEKEMKKVSPNWKTIYFLEQEQLIEWIHALYMLKNPPIPESESAKNPNEINQTMRLIEEMEAQDRLNQSSLKGLEDTW